MSTYSLELCPITFLQDRDTTLTRVLSYNSQVTSKERHEIIFYFGRIFCFESIYSVALYNSSQQLCGIVDTYCIWDPFFRNWM